MNDLSLRRLTVPTVAIGVFITSLDINVVNTALPVIQRSFGVSVSSVQWIVIGYLFVICAMQLIMGLVADLAGAKKVYTAGLVGFTLASLWCGLASNLATLIAARCIQALFGAMILATSNALITNAASSANRGKSLSATTLAVALSTMVGPPLGGFLVHQLGWNSIFLVNVPIGIVAAILAAFAIAPDGPLRSGRLDAPGSSLLLDTLSVFRIREFRVANVASSLFFVAEFLLIFIVPYYLQGVRHMSVSESGLMMLPMSLGMVLAAPIAGMLSDRFNPHTIAIAGLLLLAATSVVLAGFQASTPGWIVIADFLIAGIGAGSFQAPNANAAMGSVDASRRGVAGAALGTMRNIGMLLGEAGAATVLASALRTVPTGNPVPGISAALSGIGLGAAVVAILAAALTLGLLKQKPSAHRGFAGQR